MFSWKKIIKIVGIIGLIAALIGFCGCQKTSQDVLASNEKQEQQNTGGGADASGVAYEDDTLDYITPQDVTEDELSLNNKKDTSKTALDAKTSDKTSKEQKNLSENQASQSDETKLTSKKRQSKTNSSVAKNDLKTENHKTTKNSDTTEQKEVVSEDEQVPKEPQKATENKAGDSTCSFTIECKELLKHKDKLKKNKRGLVPEGGIIYSNGRAVFYEGESVFDVLLRETKNNKIQMEYNYTPGFQSNYIEGIANLYEFDCGELSGWTYLVNDQSPNCGCSRYKVKQGDKIIWRYTCGD